MNLKMDEAKYLVTAKKNKSKYGKETTNVVPAQIKNQLSLGSKKTLTSIPETMMTKLPCRLINIGRAKAKSGVERWPKNNESLPTAVWPAASV